jgi:hypothetical protein
VDEQRDVMNRFAIPRLFRLNGQRPPYPHLSTTPVESIDLGAFIHAVLEYSQAGAPLFPDDNLDAAIREKIGIPERIDDAPRGEVPPMPGEVMPADTAGDLPPTPPGAPPPVEPSGSPSAA